MVHLWVTIHSCSQVHAVQISGDVGWTTSSFFSFIRDDPRSQTSGTRPFLPQGRPKEGFWAMRPQLIDPCFIVLMSLEHLQWCSVSDPCENIFHIQVLVMYSFATPPIKLKLGEQIGKGLLIANHLDESLWSNNQKYSAVAIRSYLLHSFLEVHSLYQPQQRAQLCGAKTIFLSQTSISWIVFIQFYCAGSPAGDALSPCPHNIVIQNLTH